MQETWKPIPGYEAVYEVSDFGRVRSLPRNGTRGGIMSPDRPHDYLRVRLHKCNIGKRYMVHRLVMLAFVGPSDLDVNHKNGKHDDDRLENLEYATVSENQKHAYEFLSKEKMKGSRHGCSKLNESQAAEIRRLCNSGIPQIDIAERFSVSVPTVSMIHKRHTWRHV